METCSASLAFVRSFHRSPADFPHKASDAELWCVLSTAPKQIVWANNRDAGDLRLHRAHYHVTVVKEPCIQLRQCQGYTSGQCISRHGMDVVFPPTWSWHEIRQTHMRLANLVPTSRRYFSRNIPASTPQGWTRWLPWICGCKSTCIIFKYTVVIETSLLRPWWRHQMETFSALLALCAGNSPVTGEFPS